MQYYEKSTWALLFRIPKTIMLLSKLTIKKLEKLGKNPRCTIKYFNARSIP